MSAPPGRESPSQRLGDFEIVRELGRGGMGIVYEARQVSLNRPVALKVLGVGLGLTPKAVQRFRREAEAAAKLHHTNIVPGYATGEQDGTHPALKAVSPQASPADQFLGGEFHHNGAFRLSYGFEYVAMMETSKVNVNFQFDRRDTFEWYLKLGPLANVNDKYFHGQRPTWNDFVAHPSYDSFWQREAFAPYLIRVTVPTLNVAGWWDQEDFYGALKIYELLSNSRRVLGGLEKLARQRPFS
jgi:hypothetical protein